jgi:cysteine sulfinate desulfinase/cysteine desulfurase-like protein
MKPPDGKEKNFQRKQHINGGNQERGQRTGTHEVAVHARSRLPKAARSRENDAQRCTRPVS